MAIGLGDEPPGATPLDADDMEGLIPTWVATRGELNEVEQANIELGLIWLKNTSSDPGRLASIDFSDELHRRLFGDVWRWAGEHRRRATNIGVDWHTTTESMKTLFDDLAYWRKHDTYPRVEQAVRLHGRLVAIHPYRNGNGRQTRILAGAYAIALDTAPLTWGQNLDLAAEGDARAHYLETLIKADNGDYEHLLKFATS
jgi:Fic-DOC domain mobile mystery protein B